MTQTYAIKIYLTRGTTYEPVSDFLVLISIGNVTKLNKDKSRMFASSM